MIRYVCTPRKYLQTGRRPPLAVSPHQVEIARACMNFTPLTRSSLGDSLNRLLAPVHALLRFEIGNKKKGVLILMTSARTLSFLHIHRVIHRQHAVFSIDQHSRMRNAFIHAHFVCSSGCFLSDAHTAPLNFKVTQTAALHAPQCAIPCPFEGGRLGAIVGCVLNTTL